MFDGLTKSKFYTKCKTLVRMTKTRLDVLTKKKNSVIMYLKNDMADLIRTDLAYNAFCRAEGLLAEQNMLTCYNFIELFCGCISSNLSLINKQKECPEECREAVQSLIYAAARFSEFPELRDLRSAFIGRYGPSLEAFVNKEFVEMLKPKSTTKEIKLQLMHEIAQEFSIEWNAKSLEQKLFKPPPSQQDRHRHEPLPSTRNDVHKLKESKHDAFTKKNSLNDDDDYIWEKNNDDASTKRVSHDLGNSVNDTKEDTLLKRDERIFKYQGRKNVSDDRYKLQSSSEDDVFSVSRRDSTDQDTTLASSSSVGSVSEDEVDSKKPISYRFTTPPYRRTIVEKESKIEEPLKSSDKIAAEEANHADDSTNETKPKPRSVRRRPLKPPPGHTNFGSIERPLKPPPGRERVGSIERDESASINSTAMKQEEPRRGLRIFLKDDDDDDDQRDGKEKEIDGLLMHYSKNDSPYEPSKLNPYTNPPSRKISDDSCKSTRHRNAISELPLPPGRATSPREPGTQTGAATRLGRAVSAQPEKMTGRLHPNLPDYDDLAARIAALKGR
ncbi:PREDICTED: DNA (cytosine-5)-methyltransferase 1-like [Populus euphratica]|uniref:DNA (Cytosine-5)-methyltransferase 1-like n=1 Tax=Populus euphratica TaxID=75702 RepID=A0AAJ6TAK9_POPEU|nr:PREDICTED: DNA (cytosine-5)-methyltransferase 1-like [Populus euphratica]XP_011007593.1 PREDICTED: DNA (cytosine-5)-methyltransferase 1-like [Populus euphratica]XP_011007594.1 PREDICTED: DNA (cytosine-5)-methyltransferase 1-like [Populus euphratica]